MNQDLNNELITSKIKANNNNNEILKTHFSHCFDKDGNFLFDKFKEELQSNEINFSKESYGLDWLGKSYARLLASDEATTLLKEDIEFNSKPENQNAQNLLIKGDNLEVLKHLSNCYHEKIKMIYIDPPYNTGGDDFVYQDDRKFTVHELKQLAGIDEDKAKRILDFTKSKSNSHSAWLTFMYPRLYIAKRLLKDDGVIFISIDDNEVAQLRLLMDEIFGEENFVADIIWHRKYGASNDSKYLSEVHDHIILFSKNKNQWTPNLFERPVELNAKYKNPDNDLRGDWIATNLSVKTYSKANDYVIKGPHGDEFIPPPTRAWVISEEKYFELLKDNRITFGKDGKSRPYLKTFLSEVQNGIVPTTFWSYKDAGHNIGAKSELRVLFVNSTVPFDTPKPTKLIKRIISVAQKDNNSDIILDFFAGSGTTGDAVMQLNAEDGGNRKYILVQLPEKIDEKKSKTSYDFVKNELLAPSPTGRVGEGLPTIFEITKERLIRAAKKVNSELEEKTKELENKIAKMEGEIPTDDTKLEIETLKSQITLNAKIKTQNSFKIFETIPIWENYIYESKKLEEQDELFDFEKLTDEDIKTLLTTWKTYDGLPLTMALNEINLNGYTAYKGNNKLYLMNKGFKTENLIDLLQKLDNDKDFDINSIIAFGYNFESKNLREISENIKTFTNKKSSDLEFLVRY